MVSCFQKESYFWNNRQKSERNLVFGKGDCNIQHDNDYCKDCLGYEAVMLLTLFACCWMLKGLILLRVAHSMRNLHVAAASCMLQCEYYGAAACLPVSNRHQCCQLAQAWSRYQTQHNLIQVNLKAQHVHSL